MKPSKHTIIDDIVGVFIVAGILLIAYLATS